MKILLDYNLSELVIELNDLNLPAYKVKQLYKWLNRGKEFDEMTDITKEIRALLTTNYIAQPCKIIKNLISKDGTQKFLFQLSDSNVIEGVLMNYKYGNTLCVSTQVGCRMGCTFCASTIGGLIRNLTSGEILGQVTTVNNLLGGTLEDRKITNVVLMGSGEPLDNFDNVVQFLKLANDENGLNVSIRNISVSTCGLPYEIKKLADLNLPVNLTISLHSAIQSKREYIMPIAKRHTIYEIENAIKYYFKKTKRRIYIEYTLIDGHNDNEEDAIALSKLLRGIAVHINLIRLNPVTEINLNSSENIDKFLNTLLELNLSATIRRQMGIDINGACGQLRKSYIDNGGN